MWKIKKKYEDDIKELERDIRFFERMIHENDPFLKPSEIGKMHTTIEEKMQAIEDLKRHIQLLDQMNRNNTPSPGRPQNIEKMSPMKDMYEKQIAELQKQMRVFTETIDGIDSSPDEFLNDRIEVMNQLKRERDTVNEEIAKLYKLIGELDGSSDISFPKFRHRMHYPRPGRHDYGWGRTTQPVEHLDFHSGGSNYNLWEGIQPIGRAFLKPDHEEFECSQCGRICTVRTAFIVHLRMHFPRPERPEYGTVDSNRTDDELVEKYRKVA